MVLLGLVGIKAGGTGQATGGRGGDAQARFGRRGGQGAADGTASASGGWGGNADASGGKGGDCDVCPAIAGGNGGPAIATGSQGGNATGNGIRTGGDGATTPPQPATRAIRPAHSPTAFAAAMAAMASRPVPVAMAVGHRHARGHPRWETRPAR